MLHEIANQASLLGERTLQWISNAVERQLNGERFMVANQTPYELILQQGLLSVRRYPALAEDYIQAGAEPRPVKRRQHKVPVVLVPPLAADPLNFDLLPNRSLVRYLLAEGFRVYLVDFGSPDIDHSHLGLADYTTRLLPQALRAVRADSGEQELSLLGYCMGGLFCLIYAGWSHDPGLRNIVTIASPIDAHQIGIAGRLMEAMNGPARLVRKLTPFRIHNIDPGRLLIPGWVSSLAFKLTNPLGTLQSYVDLLMNLWDRDYVIEHQTMATWFNKMHAYPGGIVQDFVVQVGIDNELAAGRIRLGGRKQALLDRIDCSMLAIAGKSDRIVTVEAARKVLDIVASRDKDFMLAPGGHAGVFAGSKAPATTWAHAAQWLAARSAGKPGRRAARKEAAAKPGAGKRSAPRKDAAAARHRPRR
ncbi:MAG TPA: alpha/beta fold hydrolase [Nevskia sp.]|nr:alpha/beta fold hydrolase [Nevskia sp.]